MKVKIKATGEIANIADYSTVRLDKCDSYGVPIDYTFDEVEIINEPTENENGISSPDMPSEQRMRYELIKAAMPSCLESKYRTGNKISVIVKDALDIVDEVINQLKET